VGEEFKRKINNAVEKLTFDSGSRIEKRLEGLREREAHILQIEI